MKYATIEAGGTKFVVAVIDENKNILIRESIKTETPEITLPKVVDVIKKYDIKAIGIGSFGPIDLDLKSATYGYILQTPKTSFKNFDLVGYFKTRFDVPIGFDTDVNAAALAELKYGCAKNVDSCVYITVGTGVGGGVITSSNMVHGLTHPELGHMYVRRHPDDSYEGTCPYHKDCLEGLAAGPSIYARYGITGDKLKEDHEVWEYISYYMAQALMNIILTVSPQKIILGGGVMHQEHLVNKIRIKLMDLLNGYVDEKLFLDDYIQNPKLGDNAGTYGAYALALLALEKNQR